MLVDVAWEIFEQTLPSLEIKELLLKKNYFKSFLFLEINIRCSVL